MHPTPLSFASPRTALAALLAVAPLLLALSAPSAPELTADEEAKLATSRTIIVHPKLPSDPPEHVRARAIAEVDAAPEVVWEQLLNFQARVAENGPLKKVTIYEESWDGPLLRRKARWEIRILGREINFHCKYQHDPTQSYLEWTLDEERENDILYSWGSYQVFDSKVHPGKSRLVYTSESFTGARLPHWLNRRIAIRGLTEVIGGVRKRSEAAAAK